MSDLKPCPFCGGIAKLMPVGGSPGYWVKCLQCNADGPETGDKDSAAALWNRRELPLPTPLGES